MQIWELYSIILVDKLIKGCVKVNFEFKDKYDINDLISLITLLRAPGGCPWDREQTHVSIKSNFIEETYEVIEAINKNSISGLREELGDGNRRRTPRSAYPDAAVRRKIPARCPRPPDPAGSVRWPDGRNWRWAGTPPRPVPAPAGMMLRMS